jgi:phosphoglycolate phosphatase
LLLLFDIDGTLIRTRPRAHQEAMARAAVEVFGLPPDTDEGTVRATDPWGKTDRLILRDLLSGRAPSQTELARWEEVTCEVYRSIEDGSPSAADQRAAAVLQRLAPAHDLALVTGNLEPVARLKLEVRGLGRFFTAGQGGFGSDAEERAELVRIARRRAGDRPRADTVLIGDTPRDVEAALADGVRPIAITGGHYGRDELLAAGAAAVVDELDELDALL